MPTGVDDLPDCSLGAGPALPGNGRRTHGESSAVSTNTNERARARPALRRVAPLVRLLNPLAAVLMREDVGGQGRHVDPEDPATGDPPTARWTAAQRRAHDSPRMDLFRDGLRPPSGGTEREGVLGDLAEYHAISRDEALDLCLDWEETSVAEWEAAPRDDAEGVAQFYATVRSWSFDLLWYADLQGRGHGYPESVIVADRVGAPGAGPGRLLDLGSGAGVTAQLFATLGYEVTLADVSEPLLEFARWRLERRGVDAGYVHLPADLGTDAFDLVTALDVMVHVPDPYETAQRLHRALRPGGLLVANYDVRRRSRHNAWHLYEDDLPLRWAVQRAGFAPVALVDGLLWVYRAVPTEGARWQARSAFAWLRLASPPARALRRIRRELARAALVSVYTLLGARRPDPA